jgi:hypothetical protein
MRFDLRSVSLAAILVQDYDEIIFVDPAETGAGFFFEEIAIDRFAAQQRDPSRPACALALQIREFGMQACDLPLVVLVGLQPALVVDRMPNEIGIGGSRQKIEQQWEENGAKPPADDHSASLTDYG